MREYRRSETVPFQTHEPLNIYIIEETKGTETCLRMPNNSGCRGLVEDEFDGRSKSRRSSRMDLEWKRTKNVTRIEYPSYIT